MWTIPDRGEASDNRQSILFQEYLDVLVAAVGGLDCVLSGGAVTPQTLLTLDVAKAAVLTNGVMKAVAAGTAVIASADATNPRFDLVVITSAGAIAVRTGTAAAAPLPPVRTANDVVLAVVYVPALDTTIAANQIVDMRMPVASPITIYRTTTAETTNTTAAAIETLNKANSGVTIPNGLFLAGKILRVRIGGNMLVNSGTPTVTLAVIYGGTTMFADATVAGLADTDRIAWTLDFLLIAQGNSDQALTGHYTLQPVEVARVAPTSGQAGDLAFANTSNRIGLANFAGSAAVDSDAANRLLSVQTTFSVSNAANELVVEGATVELL